MKTERDKRSLTQSCVSQLFNLKRDSPNDERISHYLFGATQR